VKVIKHSGHIVEFDKEKLKRSLTKSGASAAIVKDVMKSIEKEMYEGISTKQIYKQAFALLKKASNSHAARYNLRSALQMLGPAGFFFEKFIARLYAAEGYETRTNLTLQGKCVTHEIDVAIKKNNVIGMIECKFHNSREANSDVKVPMYILSRFNDVKPNRHQIFSEADTITTCTIVTNNRFTTDAIAFAGCSGIGLLSWDYPPENNIRSKIDTNSLYPVTCLTTLSMVEKEKLMILDILLVRELINNSDSIQKIGLSDARIKNVMKEPSELCNYL
jgi:ATP cone domain/Restriction endonuclease